MRSPQDSSLVKCHGRQGSGQTAASRLRIKAQFTLRRSCTYVHERRNWLFIGSQLAGERAAVVMSLLQSAKLNGHEPWAYLKDVLTRLPTQLNSRIEELLPHRWQPAD